MLLQLLAALAVVVATLAAPASETDTESQGKIWAVLVAGSNGYGNYRHQADICHAYQIFHRHGVPDSNIIVMMYDDIANNDENPQKGVIINKPNGPNVYGPKKVPKDYTGDDVTPENFINVLTGNKKGNKKVLKSGPKDHVFIYFSDHGGTGLIGFPNDYLYAPALIKALKTMHKKNMYEKLVFYMEACESGSMFDKILPSNINIFATTAANPDESSYACYWDDTVEAYLGDEYSVAWMEDVDSEEHHKNMTTETLLIQYKNVVKRVESSHPKMYGQKSIDKDHVTDYIGISTNSSGPVAPTTLDRFRDSVSSRDVALRTLEKKIEKTTDEVKKAELNKKRDALLEGRNAVAEIFSRTLGKMNGVDQRAMVDSHLTLTEDLFPCYQTVVDYFNDNCVNINKNTYALSHLYKFANLCATNVPANDVIKVLTKECTEEHRVMSDVN